MLVATLDGLPPIVRFERDEDVPDELWVALAQQIDPNRNQRFDSARIEASLERFLGHRTWLGHLVRRYGIDIDFDAGCLAALAVAGREREEIDHLLSDGIAPLEACDLLQELAATRFATERKLRSFQLRDLARML